MIAMKMIEIMEHSVSKGCKPVAWRLRDKALTELRRQSRYTGDVKIKDGQATFLRLPIEIGDVRNSLGAELITQPAQA